MPISYKPLEKLAAAQQMSPFDIAMMMAVGGPELGASGEAGRVAASKLSKAQLQTKAETAKVEDWLGRIMSNQAMAPAMRQQVEHLIKALPDLNRVKSLGPRKLVHETLQLLSELGPDSINDPRVLSYLRRVNTSTYDALKNLSEAGVERQPGHGGGFWDFFAGRAPAAAKEAAPAAPAAQATTPQAVPEAPQILAKAAAQQSADDDLMNTLNAVINREPAARQPRISGAPKPEAPVEQLVAEDLLKQTAPRGPKVANPSTADISKQISAPHYTSKEEEGRERARMIAEWAKSNKVEKLPPAGPPGAVRTPATSDFGGLPGEVLKRAERMVDKFQPPDDWDQLPMVTKQKILQGLSVQDIQAMDALRQLKQLHPNDWRELLRSRLSKQ